MIVKKIEKAAADGSGDHARNVAQLVDYMRTPEKDSSYADSLLRYLEEEGIPVRGVERLLHFGASNFLSEHIQGQRAEMMAGANAALKSPNPLTHWLLSWKEHEHPTNRQIDEAAASFLRNLGLDGCQAFYAAHADTHNVHLHIAVNRYDPARGRMIEVNNGLDLEAAHRAVAFVVHEQHWEPEGRARYRIEDGSLRARPDIGDKNGVPRIEAAALSFEARTGLKSAQRIAIEEAGPAMLQARSWHELHYALAERGMELVPSGAGAVLRMGEMHVKASSAHRRCSFDKLQERLGEFKSRLPSVRPVKRLEDLDVMPEAIGALEFRRARGEILAAKVQAVADAKDARDVAIRNARELAREDRKALDKLNDGGRSPQRSALMSVINEKRSAAEAEAKLAAKEAIKRINQEYRLSADYERWLREQNADYLADRWRKRNKLAKWLATYDGKSDHFYHLQKLDGFRARELGGVRLWAKADERVAFVEHKSRIEIAMRRDTEAIVAAFTIAASKFGQVTVNGSDEFKNHAAAVIAAAGYADAVVNPELRGILSSKTRNEVHRIVTKQRSAASSQPEPEQTDVSPHVEIHKSLKDRENGR